MNGTQLSIKKILIGIFTIILMTITSMLGMLYWTSTLLIKYTKLTSLSPSVFLPFQFAKYGIKHAKAAGGLATIVSIGLPILVFGCIAYALFAPRRRALHGSARFANDQELRKSGLLEKDQPSDKYPSIIVGKRDKHFLLYRGQQFMFLAAPTRSGKGVGVVIPNLLHYRDSVVVLDIKSENYAITAGFRTACGQEIHKFAPDDESFQTACWNPLAYVRHDPLFRVTDLMGITNILYPPSDDVWSSTAESLFLGLALYIMDTAKLRNSFNIATIKKLETNLSCLANEETLLEYIEERKEFEPLSEECIMHLRKYAQTSDKVRNSISISFNQPLSIFSDPITAQATSKNTFDMRNVRKKRMSIYVVIKPSNIGKFGKFLNLFFQQLLMLNMDKQPQEDPALKYQCLLLLDEFPAMGKIAIIEKASAYMASYNMRLLLVFQSKSQLKNRILYDENGTQTMLANMALQIIFAPKDEHDAKDYSEMLGYYSETGITKSRQLSGKTGRSESQNEQRRAVLLPQEIKAIGADKEIINLENMRPALVDKIFWYNEPVFQQRANLALPPIPSQQESSNTIEPIKTLPVFEFNKTIKEQTLSSNATFEVGFSPKRQALEVVISFIQKSENELFVAAYSFTSKEIAFALVEAKTRGVDVRILVDHEQNTDQKGYQAIDYLSSQNIPVIRSSNYAAMHHKFMVADSTHLQMGSFNYTHSANSKNAETAIVLNNVPILANIYRTEWLRLSSEPKVSIDAIMKVDRGLEVLKELGI